MSQERERLLLEEQYPDGKVATGFTFRFEIVAQPVERVLFEIGNHDGIVLTRLWFELDQFAQFTEIVNQVAGDAGCFPEEDAD
jgi:hypothetical protein